MAIATVRTPLPVTPQGLSLHLKSPDCRKPLCLNLRLNLRLNLH
jgi:hypothetical protein